MHSWIGIAPAGTLNGYWYVKRYVKFNILAHYKNAGRYGLRWCIACDYCDVLRAGLLAGLLALILETVIQYNPINQINTRLY